MNKLCVFLAILAIAQAFPTNSVEEDPELKGGFFEGDLELTNEQLFELTSPLSGRNGVTNLKRRWPDNKVYFKITGDFSEFQYTIYYKFTLIIENVLKFRKGTEKLHYGRTSSH